MASANKTRTVPPESFDFQDHQLTHRHLGKQNTTGLAHNHMSKPHPIIQTVLDAHFPGVAKPVVMEESDEIEALAHELRIRTAERDALAAMASGMRQSPDMRDVVGHLRAIDMELGAAAYADARRRVRDLLRRLQEPQT